MAFDGSGYAYARAKRTNFDVAELPHSTDRDVLSNSAGAPRQVLEGQKLGQRLRGGRENEVYSSFYELLASLAWV